MRNYSFQGSGIKQSVVDKIMSLLAVHDRRNKLRILTLPGELGFRNPNSLENQILSRWRWANLVCVEKDSATVSLLEQDLNQHPHANRVELWHTPLQRYLRPVEPGDIGTFDLMYLDLMGAYSQGKRSYIKDIFNFRFLETSGVLAVTINVSARCRWITGSTLEQHHLAPHHQSTRIYDDLARMAKLGGFPLSNKPMVDTYGNYDQSTKANTMSLSILRGMGGSYKRPSMSAYE